MKRHIASLIQESANRIENRIGEIRFTRDERLFLEEHFERMELRKNDYLIRQGEVELYFYFIESGIVRYWSVEEEGEFSFQFVFEGEFAGSGLTVGSKQCCYFSIQTLQETITWRISRNKLAMFCTYSLNMNKTLCLFFEILNIRYNRIIRLLHLSSKARYQSLSKEEKSLLLSIPSKYIASYLGMTPQNLSRVRKR